MIKKLIKFILIFLIIAFLGFGFSFRFKLCNKEVNIGTGEIIEKITSDINKTGLETKLQIKVDKKEDILNSEEVDDIRKDKNDNIINYGKIISYDYVTNIEIATQTLSVSKDKTLVEDVSQRTSHSFTFKTGNKNEYKKIFLAGNLNRLKNGKWYRVEPGATTTIDAWNKQIKDDSKLYSFLSRFKNKTTAANYEATAATGNLIKQGGAWATMRKATAAGTVQKNVSGGEAISSCAGPAASASANVFYRGAVPMNTSDLPAAANISAASLFLYGGRNDGRNITNGYQTIVGSTQASPTDLVAEDYDVVLGSLNSETEFSSRIWSYAGTGRTVITLSGYNEFIFNASGIAGITKTGYTKLGLRSGQDISNTQPSGTYNYNLMAYYGPADTSGTKDPYLSVTYTVAAASSPSQTPIIFD